MRAAADNDELLLRRWRVVPGRPAPVSWGAVGPLLMFELRVVALVAEHNLAAKAGDRTSSIGGATGGGPQNRMKYVEHLAVFSLVDVQ